jgi:hypothetical protein
VNTLYTLAQLINTLIIFQCTALAFFIWRSAERNLSESWLRPAVLFCLNSSLTVLVHLLSSDPFHSLFSHSIHQLFSSLFHILLGVNIYLIPRLIHQTKRYGIYRLTELLFLACAVFTVGYEFYRRTGIVFLFLVAALLYLVVFSIGLYFSRQAAMSPK